MTVLLESSGTGTAVSLKHPAHPCVRPRGDTQQGLTAKDMNEPESSQPLSGQGGRD